MLQYRGYKYNVKYQAEEDTAGIFIGYRTSCRSRSAMSREDSVGYKIEGEGDVIDHAVCIPLL